MVAALFLKGLVLGFSIAAPIGPIGVLCIRRTLAGGMTSGLITGLGTATADALYGLVAAFGLTAVAVLFIDHQFILRLGGGLFLCYLGATAFRAPPAQAAAGGRSGTLWRDYASAFVLTITNPLTILSFAAVFVGLGIGADPGFTAAGVTVLGIFAGSLLWWLLLSGVASLIRAKLDYTRLKWINRLSGLVVVAFGLACLYSLAG
jgi:Putative threonine efflux protein